MMNKTAGNSPATYYADLFQGRETVFPAARNFLPGTSGSSKSGDPVVFIHIPKTGGMTLYSMIRDIYKPSELHKINPAMESIEKYRHLSQDRKDKLKVIYGHMDYRIHELLPPNSRYVTLMRNPVERVISHYHYVRRTADDPLRELAMRSSLDDWVERCNLLEMDNGQTRRLSGSMDSVMFGECSAEMLERARHNVQQHFALVGITERFDETYGLMSKLFDWPIKLYLPRNVAQQRSSIKEIPVRTIRLIEKFNALDMELYAHATRLFADRLSQTDIENEVRLLKEKKENPFMLWGDVASQYAKEKLRKWVKV
ncbi:MAG: sulfotransferase family 2 domain-containing protein [Sulfuricella sp.]|nr:sulfotransferase family 2 domain-containing protein [Sulfuricella sp.]